MSTVRDAHSVCFHVAYLQSWKAAVDAAIEVSMGRFFSELYFAFRNSKHGLLFILSVMF